MSCVSRGGIGIAPVLHRFVNEECLKGTGIEAERFWAGLGALIRELTPVNGSLLSTRDRLQGELDRWHREHRGRIEPSSYREFLRGIGYLCDTPAECTIGTENVDPELAHIAGPQLVVPLDNARYALNAANARWGSLYDALYGTDAIDESDGAERRGAYNRVRGGKVVAFVRGFLDRHFPLTLGTHRDVVRYCIDGDGLTATLSDGGHARLERREAAVGYHASRESPSLVLLRHNGLHVELHVDRAHPIGREDSAGICDVVLESAVSSIQDCEDSVAAVDADDKIHVYRNWLGLMQGTLEANFLKDGKRVTRRLNPDRTYTAIDGSELSLPGRSLMLVRNVGHFIMSDAITLDGEAIPETFIDAAVTGLIAMHDLSADKTLRNSRTGSVYIVKPKMHGPAEVELADRLFERVEDLLGLARYTLKMGIMDEERRTSVNLRACIHAARNRVVFINTGFLDRTGDEIHSCMEAGPVVRKNDMKSARWLNAYEQLNVQVGLACGLGGRAQIGKGMWAMPDLMSEMIRTKGAQLAAGANTAWVPSPTAATLHAMHYHEVNVAEVQRKLMGRVSAKLDDVLSPATIEPNSLKAADVQEELNNNIQSILGYVVRWINLGIGCSKVPDYHDVALMEDRATLRISSQHVANWLHHGICTKAQVERTLREMAAIVDSQNTGDPLYEPMAPEFERSFAYLAARELIFAGRSQPNGYTERILHQKRRERKGARDGSSAGE